MNKAYLGFFLVLAIATLSITALPSDQDPEALRKEIAHLWRNSEVASIFESEKRPGKKEWMLDFLESELGFRKLPLDEKTRLRHFIATGKGIESLRLESLPFLETLFEELRYKSYLPHATFDRAPSKIEESEVNRYLRRKDVCSFWGRDWDPTIMDSDRLKTVSNSAELLAKCLQIKDRLGPKSCGVISFNGHAHYLSVALYRGYGATVSKDGLLITEPRDRDHFTEISKCLREISFDKAPVIFSTCGGVEHGEVTVFYGGKVEGQQWLSDYLQRPIISGVGGVGGDEKSSTCDYGWHQSHPKSKSVQEAPLPSVIRVRPDLEH